MKWNMITPYPGMVIKESTKFEPGHYDFLGKDGIIIDGDNIVIDGNGAVIKGGAAVATYGSNDGNKDEFGYEKLESGTSEKNLGFYGIGIKCHGHSNVTIKNLSVKGFDIGLWVKDSNNCLIEFNDFSDNFTDPAWGWDDHGFHGGIFFEGVHDTTVRENKANNVWDAIHLRYSDRNHIERNDFSHVSDVCLKLWNSCENIIMENDLSYGIRIDPGEVHARDSSGVLIESGSNHNIFKRNDITHGGDGIFIRVLNGWMSTGNYFEENDCSYANNNAIEVWANGNTYVRNKANYSSYGFWLGGSDDTLMLENEVAFNGTNYSNAPESFGNAGIAVVNGSSSHFRVIGNYVHDNNGPGIAIRFNPDYPAYHWVIQKNVIINNKNKGIFKGHGIYLKNARWIDIGANNISANEGESIYIDDNTSDVFLREAEMDDASPAARLKLNKKTFHVDEEIVFDASESADPLNNELCCRWDFNDGTLETGMIVKHSFKKPGFYRVGLTVNNGKLADIGFKNVYVVPSGEEIGTNDNSENWSLISDDADAALESDSEYFVSNSSSIKVSAKSGVRHILSYPNNKALSLDLSEKYSMSFFLKFQAEVDTDWSRSNKKPIIRIFENENNYFEYIPHEAYLEQLFAPISEQKYEWKFIQFELNNPSGWNLKAVGNPDFKNINYFQFEEGPCSSGRSYFWIDGVKFLEEPLRVYRGVDLACNDEKSEFPRPIYSYSSEVFNSWAPISGNHEFLGDITPRWSSYRENNWVKEDWYGVEFNTPREINRIDLYIYHNLTGSLLSKPEGKPNGFNIEYYDGEKWLMVKNTRYMHSSVEPNLNRVEFDTICTEKVRAIFVNSDNSYTALYAFEAYNTDNKCSEASIISSNINGVKLNRIGIMLNMEHNDTGSSLSDLIIQLYEMKDGIPAGELLKEMIVPRSDIKFGEETIIEFPCSELKPLSQYAIVLTQRQLAQGRTVGDYYRWVAGNKEGTESFGVYTEGEFRDETSTWGTAWLKVYTDKYVIDESHCNEGLGNRLGLIGQEKRWQSFTIKDPIFTVLDGSIKQNNGWTSNEEHEEDWIEIRFKEETNIKFINIYFHEDNLSTKLPQYFEIEFDNSSFKIDTVIKGFNKCEFNNIASNNIKIRIKNLSGTVCCIKEIEII